ncbi:hypothetical protein ColTof4_05881 [Colletotrichum tofieldiae]|nr:hypothetical protein ColTof3_01055 [Colletotrichum tofieldiae]GKT73458.1 hypothetical protein ColTof4_05881 [Colletotrichum tofieldiae]
MASDAQALVARLTSPLSSRLGGGPLVTDGEPWPSKAARRSRASAQPTRATAGQASNEELLPADRPPPT